MLYTRYGQYKQTTDTPKCSSLVEHSGIGKLVVTWSGSVGKYGRSANEIEAKVRRCTLSYISVI